MNKEVLLDKVSQLVEEGLEYDDIKKRIDDMRPEKEDRNVALQKADEWIFHRVLAKEEKGRAIGQMLMGGVLMLFPLLVAYLTYDPNAKTTYLWYGAALLGAWLLKEGYKKYRTPFVAPDNYGYKRGKFDRF